LPSIARSVICIRLSLHPVFSFSLFFPPSMNTRFLQFFFLDTYCGYSLPINELLPFVSQCFELPSLRSGCPTEVDMKQVEPTSNRAHYHERATRISVPGLLGIQPGPAQARIGPQCICRLNIL
jgi:hypothetical protein